MTERAAGGPVVLVRIKDGLSRELAAETLRLHGFVPIVRPLDQPLLSAVQEAGPEVVILDLALEESVDRLERTLADVLACGARALLVADGASPQHVLAGLLAGASGQVLLESTSPQRFIRAVRQVAEGSAALHPDVASLVLQQWRQMRSSLGSSEREVALSVRESQILSGAAEGLTNQAIARRLDVSLKTVENHKARIFAKLGARNQAEALSMAIRRGLLPQ
jgi:two-component system nitrate/nitrite response regulator NarL